MSTRTITSNQVTRTVVRFEDYQNCASTRDMWPVCTTAVLDCGHRVPILGATYRPAHMRCGACAREAARDLARDLDR